MSSMQSHSLAQTQPIIQYILHLGASLGAGLVVLTVPLSLQAVDTPQKICWCEDKQKEFSPPWKLRQEAGLKGVWSRLRNANGKEEKGSRRSEVGSSEADGLSRSRTYWGTEPEPGDPFSVHWSRPRRGSMLGLSGPTWQLPASQSEWTLQMWWETEELNLKFCSIFVKKIKKKPKVVEGIFFYSSQLYCFCGVIFTSITIQWPNWDTLLV